MTRTTQKILDSLIERINIKLQRPATSYTHKDKKYTQNEGNIHLDNSYGGLQIETMSEHGIHLEFGYHRLTKGQMEEKLCTILQTMSVIEEAIISRL